ncbi:hypothetical protein C8J57DRAFT_1233745 [Mycena rebaudengoi]|nr:hypothetical protein C8J57DRAFT_1233745 [Mycena rebaudengoi]
MSSASYPFAQVEGLAVLDSPRKHTARTTVFTVALYTGLDHNQTPTKLFGLGRHYAATELRMTISKLEPGVNIHDTVENASKYSFVGDIKDLTLLEEAPGEGEGWYIDPRERVYANLCGVCVQSDKNSATFTMDVEQYTTSFTDLAKQVAEDPTLIAFKSTKSIFPISGYIPDSPRYSRGKPIPHAKKYTAVGGYLAGMSSSLQDDKAVDRFRIEVDTVALGLGSFVPMAVSTPASASTSSNTASTSTTSGKRWNYDVVTGPRKRGRKDNGDDAAPSSSPSPFSRT